ncbi:MAG: tetratricopeptide repeat protein, partial [Bacteroidia bacterium]
MYNSLLRTQPLPDSLRLQVYLRGAEAWADLKKPQEALHWVAPAESLALRLQDTLRYAELLGWKGVFHSQHRVYAEAEMVLQKALRLAEAQKVQPTPFYAVLWQRWGRLALDQRKYEEAERRFRWAAQVLEGLGLVEEAVYGSVLHSLALLYWEKGRYAEAESLYLR